MHSLNPIRNGLACLIFMVFEARSELFDYINQNIFDLYANEYVKEVYLRTKGAYTYLQWYQNLVVICKSLAPLALRGG